jgi:hypothetical protein
VPLAGPLLPLLRPVLVAIAGDAIASDAGTAALASAIADAVLQASLSGPIVVDVRAAVLAGAATAPEPFASLARAATLDRDVGLVVLRGDGRSAGQVLADRSASRATSSAAGPRLLGMTPGVARLVAAALLLAGLVALVGPAPRRAPTAPPAASSAAPPEPSSPRTSGRAPRIAWAASGLLIAAGPAALVLRRAPALLVARLTTTSPATSSATTTQGGGQFGPSMSSAVEALAPSLVAGIERMLTTPRMLAATLALVATAALAAALTIILRSSSSRPTQDASSTAHAGKVATPPSSDSRREDRLSRTRASAAATRTCRPDGDPAGQSRKPSRSGSSSSNTKVAVPVRYARPPTSTSTAAAPSGASPGGCSVTTVAVNSSPLTPAKRRRAARLARCRARAAAPCER